MDEVLSWVQTDTTTVNIAGPPILQVVVSVLAVVCKCMQQHWDMQSIERRMQPLRLWRPWHGNAYAWPLQCWKSCANGSNIVAFHFSDQLTEQKRCWELSAQNFDRFQALHNNCRQHATTRNIQQCWELLTNNVEFIWTGPYTEK